MRAAAPARAAAAQTTVPPQRPPALRPKPPWWRRTAVNPWGPLPRSTRRPPSCSGPSHFYSSGDNAGGYVFGATEEPEA
uniref:Uncharacterized protein n=1 Tax=Knipowitschia caucasica TaxID=637954 RepID=A0AAV2K161_KNICA